MHAFFHQMNSLANILLVDLLFASSREKAAGQLNWRSEACLMRLSEHLLTGYVTVMAGYSGEAPGKCRHFAEKCGHRLA